MTRGQEIIKEVENFFAEIRAKYPNITDEMLDSQGAIYYMNGNDGTDFDWNANQRCCEFYMFHKNEKGFIKVHVYVDDEMEAYVYPNGEMNPAEELKSWLGKGDALYLATLLYKMADKEYIYDEIITEIDFSYEPKEWELQEMNEAYEENENDDYWHEEG